MRIGELARRAGTTTRALRYYEEQGLLRPDRTGNGYREYGEDAVVRVAQIRALLDAGFNSRTVAQLLPCAKGSRPHIELCPSVVAAMRGTLDRIEAELKALDSRRSAVTALLGAEPVTGAAR
ncbi:MULTISPECIES: MerR family transcriptional regulator [Amycolatopsis]|uniref:DNA-binding transcriptional regulator, MerR family n=2 Tax=Amycolatopsis TaxID=1813 RepID=A0A1I4B327_9PSEU|nr:MerR family transcriptional regulator [Amycolatopsis sacchari]SFK62451.1 DNA-binding transcriptional regulator, MerR family [Amycolatopsis sacchari]